MNIIKQIYLTIILLVLDISWIYLNYNNYNKIVEKIQGSSIKLNIIPGILCYLNMKNGKPV